MAGPRDTDPRVVGVIAGVIIVLIAVIAVGLLNAEGEDAQSLGVDGGLTATPLASATAADPTGSPTPSTTTPVQTEAQDEGSDDAAGGPSSDEPTSEADAGSDPQTPTDADAADFVARLAPEQEGDAEVVLADIDEDGVSEVLVASLLGGRVRLDVAGWTGGRYELAYSDEGGTAEAISSVRVTDLDGDTASMEIVVRHTSGTSGESASLWGRRDDQLVGLEAVDGCWDGSNTYGITGVTIEPQQITATCDGSPAPVAAWPSDVYVWDPELQAFAYQRTIE